MGKKSRERREKFQQLQQRKQITDLHNKSLLADKLHSYVKLAALDLLNDAYILDYCPIDSEIILTDSHEYNRLYSKKYGKMLPREFLDTPEEQYTSIIAENETPCLPPFEHSFVEFDDSENYPVLFLNNKKVSTGVKIDLLKLEDDDCDELCWNARMHICSRFSDNSDNIYPVVTARFDNGGYLVHLECENAEHEQYDEVSTAIRASCIALFTFSVLHCRNIELIDHEPDPAISRQYQQHFGQPLTTYKTLRIKPIGKQYDSSEPKDYQGLMPLHLRRGNFAHYTEDAPLFGKYTGTFWRPATAVGEAKNGTVIKDYKVIASDELQPQTT